MESIVIEFWHWLILGVALMVVEVIAPGVFMLWLGVAALIVGSITYFVPDISWQIQLGMFSVLSVGAVGSTWRWVRGRPTRTDRPSLNLRGEQYLGRVVELEGPIRNSRGRARVGDSIWAVSGPDLPAGTAVRITDVDGTVLLVEPVETPTTDEAAPSRAEHAEG